MKFNKNLFNFKFMLINEKKNRRYFSKIHEIKEEKHFFLKRANVVLRKMINYQIM